MRKKLYFLITIVILLVVLAVFYIVSNQSMLDAKINTDVVDISSKISGKIIELNISDNAQVKKGEILAKIDSSDLEKELNSYKLELEQMQTEKIPKNEIEKNNLRYKKIKDEMQLAQNNLDSANNDYVLYKNAYKDGSVTKKDLNNATKNLEVARNNYKKAQENFKVVSKDYKELDSKKSTQDKEISELMAKIEEMELNLSYTSVISPLNGCVLHLNSKIGDYAKKDSPLMSIISNDVYVLAIPDKNSSKNPKKGQKVIVKVKNKKFEAVVDSVSDNYIKILFKDDISQYNFKPKTKAKIKI